MPQLDGLRAIAVFGVVATHFGNSALTGFLGVRLFFVLSGFLITSLLLRARDRLEIGHATVRTELVRFYRHRAFRLYPALLLFVVACYAFDWGQMREFWPWHLFYLSNVFFAAHEGQWFPVFVLWTLAVEEQFYLAWPLFMFVVPRRYLSPGCVITIGIGVAFRAATWSAGQSDTLWYLPFGVLDTLAIGALLAVTLDPSQQSVISYDRLRWVTRNVGVWFFVVIAAVAAFGMSQWVRFVFLDFASALLFVWIVSSAARGIDGVPGRLLSLPPMLFLGRISYGIYLFHVLSYYVVGWIVRGSLHIDIFWKFWIYAAVSVTLASLSWYLWEKPIQRRRDDPLFVAIRVRQQNRKPRGAEVSG